MKYLANTNPWPNKNLNLVMDANSVHDIWATGDKQRIMQALQYLLDNALKFTSEGQISIRVSQVVRGVRFDARHGDWHSTRKTTPNFSTV